MLVDGLLPPPNKAAILSRNGSGLAALLVVSKSSTMLGVASESALPITTWGKDDKITAATTLLIIVTQRM